MQSSLSRQEWCSHESVDIIKLNFRQGSAGAAGAAGGGGGGGGGGDRPCMRDVGLLLFRKDPSL